MSGLLTVLPGFSSLAWHFGNGADQPHLAKLPATGLVGSWIGFAQCPTWLVISAG